jgi:hypothetical protein
MCTDTPALAVISIQLLERMRLYLLQVVAVNCEPSPVRPVASTRSFSNSLLIVTLVNPDVSEVSFSPSLVSALINVRSYFILKELPIVDHQER